MLQQCMTIDEGTGALINALVLVHLCSDMGNGKWEYSTTMDYGPPNNNALSIKI